MTTSTVTTAPIVLTDAAVKIVNADVAAFKADGKRYAAYIAEMNVTPETVAAHVALFREGYKAKNSDADPAMVKAYATKVRNGLNTNLGGARTTVPATALITKLGADAELEAVIAAWHDAQD